MEQVGFAVEPKYDCPHVDEYLMPYPTYANQFDQNGLDIKTNPCKDCQNVGENWVCLKCGQVYCSRYVKEHALLHAIETNHAISLSFSDLSVWCYHCESYIANSETVPYINFARNKKFKNEQEMNEHFDNIGLGVKVKKTSQQKQKKVEEIPYVIEEEKFEIPQSQQKEFNYTDLIQGFQTNTYKKVLIMIGAGASLQAGVPNFRSANSQIYENIKKQYNLENSDLIFTSQFFQQQPEVFYTFFKDYYFSQFSPTPAHYFIKVLQDKNKLHGCFSLNIDSLELKAGVKEENLVQTHGSFNTSHCLKCQNEFQYQMIEQNIKNGAVPMCSCGGIIKPDLIFFGDNIPNKFQDNISKCENCDLVIVIGTSFKVFPFAWLKQVLPHNVPKVLIDKEINLASDLSNYLCLVDQCDKVITQLCKDIGWEGDLRQAFQN